MDRCIFLLFLLFANVAYAQDIEYNLIVHAEQTGEANNSVYRTLEQSLSEFVNQTSWSNRNLEQHERVSVSMFINLVAREGNTFSGSLEVQAARPVFGSTLQTPILNVRDDNFSFEYIEHENLEFSPDVFRSNLVSVISFYIYTILGLDADTFEMEGGTFFYQQANRIVGAAQTSNYPGWASSDGRQGRYQLNSNLLSSAYVDFRHALYTYHRQGLDLMHSSLLEGKQGVRSAISQLENLNSVRPGANLIRIFFDAKAREIEQIFSGGPSVPMDGLYRSLNRMAPTYADLWRSIPD